MALTGLLLDHRRVLVAVWIVLLLLAASALGATVWLTQPEPEPPATAAVAEESLDWLSVAQAAGLDEEALLIDSDGDELPDVIENFGWGSNPDAFSTTGNGIPDGWFARYGHDPTIPGIEARAAATPPPDVLPEVYEGAWPEAYSWTLADAYQWNEPADHPNGTVWDNGIDPREWGATPDGVPFAWLHRHGLPLNAIGIEDQSLAGDGLTVRENYLHDTDPTDADTDDDGLPDSAEIGVWNTDPRNPSTSGTGIPDGWLISFGLDAADPLIGHQDPAGKGMSLLETFEHNRAALGLEATLRGEGLHPLRTSTAGHGIPDGWLLDHGLDALDPTVPEDTVQCASDFPDVRHLDDAPDGAEPVPDLCLNVEEYYAFGRPDGWDESRSGPWRGGLDPTTPDQDGDGLPDAAEIRGWWAERTVGLGPNARPEPYPVRADPTTADTDGDGLTDAEEYLGRAERDDAAYRWAPTDPMNADSSFSGLTDFEKVFGLPWRDGTVPLHRTASDGTLEPLLNVTQTDSDGDFLADGDEFAFWMASSEAAAAPYPEAYPGSNRPTRAGWVNQLEWLDGRQLGSAEVAALLSPQGDADGDGVPNILDPDSDEDGLLDGFEVDPALLEFSQLNFDPSCPRAPTDPANPETDGDRLPDGWELANGGCNEGRWDLDPSHWDSDSDDVSDAEENLDGDVVEYHVYFEDADGLRPDQRVYEYTNFDEFAFGTEPRRVDQNADGVTEGWVAFWREVYPTLLETIEQSAGGPEASEARDRVGDRTPPLADVDDALDAGWIGHPLSDVGPTAKDTLEFLRFVEVDLPPSVWDERLRPEYSEDWANPVPSGDPEPQEYTVTRGGIPVQRTIGIIQGTYTHRFAHDQALGLNPYLLDADGDGLRDAWTAYHAPQCPPLGLLPAEPSGHLDPDEDGRTNLQEYLAGNARANRLADLPPFLETDDLGNRGPDPCAADTDLGGEEDGDEAAAALSPTSPVDDIQLGEPDRDDDGDGVTADQERRQGTADWNPDSSANGLADGCDIIYVREPFPAGASRAPTPLPCAEPDFEEAVRDPKSANDAAFFDLIDDYKARGVAHREETIQREGHDWDVLRFYGARGRGGDPAEQDTSGDGIPDGWLSYYGRSPVDAPRPELVDRYSCGRPSWWNEEQLGVWWWGLPPAGFDGRSWPDACPADRDLDGLLDAGEDPVPAASNTNLPDDTLGTLPDALAAPPSRDVTVRMGQAWGECPGNPVPCFLEWNGQPALQQRVAVTVADLEVTGLGAAGLPDLAKTGSFTVTGRVIVDCAGATCPADEQAVPNRTVVIGLRGDDGSRATLGVAFTESDGAFTAPACFCADGSVEIPHDGMVALNRAQGTASWTNDLRAFEPGAEATVTMHVYATTTTFWGGIEPDQEHPHYEEFTYDGQDITATHRYKLETHPMPTVRVTSATQLALQTAGTVPWATDSRELAGTVRLTDASGTPVAAETVQVNAGELGGRSVATDPQGQASFAFTDLGARVGTITVRASYPGSPDGALGEADDAEAQTVLQAPLDLHVQAATSSLTAGEPLDLLVEATSLGVPLADVEVRASLDAFAAQAATDAEGRATLRILTGSLSPGIHGWEVLAEETDQYTGAAQDGTLSLVSGVDLQATVPTHAERGATLKILGSLRLTDGTGIDEAPLRFSLQGEELGQTLTDDQGRFDVSVAVPHSAEAGLGEIGVHYAGLPGVHEAAESVHQIRVVVPTNLTLHDVRVGRGDTATLTGRLTNGLGDPLAGQFVNLTVGDEDVGTVLTRHDGRFESPHYVADNASLGEGLAQADYLGSDNLTYGPSTARAILHVTAPTVLETSPPEALRRGANVLTGRLAAPEGDPLANATVTLTTGFGPAASAASGNDGVFRIAFTVPPHAEPGLQNLTVMYDGDATHGPASAEIAAPLVVPTTLRLAAPADAGRGADVVVRVAVLDDRGRGVPGPPVVLRFLDSDHEWLLTPEGTVEGNLSVPPEIELGTVDLAVTYPGDVFHEPASLVQTLVVKDGVRLAIDPLPDRLEPGQTFVVSLRLTDAQGDPLAGQVVGARLDGAAVAVHAETDEAGNAELPMTAAGSDQLVVRAFYPGTDVLASQSAASDTIALVAPPAPSATQVPTWLAPTGATAIVLLAALGLVAWLVLRHRPHVVERILKDADRRIRAGTPWAAAVLLAYRRLSVHLEQQGFPERETETAREFIEALHEAVPGLPSEAAVGMVRLFERARYAQDPVGAAEARAARQNLRLLVHAIRSHVATVQDGDGGSPA